MKLSLWLRILISPIKMCVLLLYAPIMLLILFACEEDLAMDSLESIIKFGK